MIAAMRFGETDLHGEASAERTRESDEANERAVITLFSFPNSQGYEAARTAAAAFSKADPVWPRTLRLR